MAKVTAWGFGTNTLADTPQNVSSINPVSDFALVTDDPTECALVNGASDIDAPERLSYQARKVNQVVTDLDVANPGPSSKGVQYVVRLDEILKVTDSADATYRKDLPFVGYVVIRHPIDGDIQPSHVDTMFQRLSGACYKETTAGISTRFGDLMKSALHPTVDGIDPTT